MASWLRESAIYLVKRLAAILLVLLGVATVTFFVTRFLGNPVYLLVGQQVSKEIVDNMMHQMGLDRPMPEQYLRYLDAVVHGDFGVSRVTQRPVLVEIQLRLPATLELVTAAMVLIVVGGISIGVASAIRPGGALDRLGGFITRLGISIPDFWIGLILVFVFYYKLKWAPAPLGRVASDLAPPARLTGLLVVDSLMAQNWSALGSALAHLALPAITLALVASPSTIQITRNALTQILSSDYIRTARAYGMPARTVYFRYALKNAIVPVITMLAMTFGFLMSSTVLVETVFNWPGIGLYAVNSMQQLDYEPILGVVFLSALFYALAYLVADLVTFAVDPRISAQ